MASSQSLLLTAFLSVVVVLVAGVRDDPVSPQTKIVGGHYIEINQAPWIAFLQFFLNVTHFDLCGGSIISSRWVLTAAHCSVGYQKSQMVITIGSKSPLFDGRKYQVEKVVNHDEYVGGIYLNDIAVLRTATDMILDGRTTKAMVLPAMGMKRPNVETPLLVTGWGSTESGLPSQLLMAINVVLNDFNDCSIFTMADESKQLCIGLKGKNACSGDSGGPVVMGNLQVGIVSYRVRDIPCADYPSIYTDVVAYRGWIKNHTDV